MGGKGEVWSGGLMIVSRRKRMWEGVWRGFFGSHCAGGGVCVCDGETDGSKLGRHVACIEGRGGSGRAGDKQGG